MESHESRSAWSLPGASGGWQDVLIPLHSVAVFSLWFTLGLGLTTLVVFGALWGFHLPFQEREGWSLLFGWLGAFTLLTLAYLGGALVHELLHALGMILFAGIPVRSIHMAVRLREGIAYVHTALPMTVAAYRWVLVLPGLLLGLLPLAAGLLLGDGWLTAFGVLMLTSAAGDAAVLWLLRPFASTYLARDHPTAVGCRVAPPG